MKHERNGTTSTKKKQHQDVESSRFSTQVQVPGVQRADQAQQHRPRSTYESSNLPVRALSCRVTDGQNGHNSSIVCSAVVHRSLCSISSGHRSQGSPRLIASGDGSPFGDRARGKLPTTCRNSTRPLTDHQGSFKIQH